MKVYIDCGAHNGDSIQEFLENRSIFLHRPDANDYKIYAVEPNAAAYKLAERFPNKNVEIMASVAWTHDGEVEFKNAPESLSSCVSEYTMQCYDEKYSNKVVFPCFNLAQFIKNLDADYLVLKMDVESSEYALLPQLVVTGAIHRIGELYVEFHHVWNGENIEKKKQVVESIKQHCKQLKFFDNWP